MCGIAGIWDIAGDGGHDLGSDVGRMMQAIVRRGPDSDGIWLDPGPRLALGHRRLAIVDLSDAGRQPMPSRDGRFVITYNGELYNTAEIARDLAGASLRGHSDTEVVLEACARWGVEAALPRFAGMFAFALWDRRDRVLWLVRDRIGIKPLVYARQQGRLLFASDLTALAAAPEVEMRVDPVAVAGFLRRAYVPAPHTILRGVRKLPPGHLLRVPADGEPDLRCWWSLERAARDAEPLDQSPEGIADGLEALLEEVVGQHLVSDVPLGAFLSGGIDSSLVVAMMCRATSAPVHSFSIGFRDSRYDESGHARAVAEHLGTRHTELVVEPAHAQAVIPKLVEIYDEPFADASQIPTFLVSQLARQSVTVALSGDGGDEGFAGYSRYGAISRLWRLCGGLPAGPRRLSARAMRFLSPEMWDRLGALLPRSRRPRLLGEKVAKAARLLAEPSVEDMYRQAVSHWPRPQELIDAPEPGFPDCAGLPDTVARLRYLDMGSYLPDDILTKVDRASMAVSLEARVPLLDHRIVGFAWRLPTSRLIADGEGKQPLRRVLARHLPPALFERPKMGFALPVGDWLRGPLRDWAEDLLSRQSLEEAGLVEPAPVRRALALHMGGRRACQHELWTVLMLQAWARHWRVGL